jgi:hypothetical protein
VTVEGILSYECMVLDAGPAERQDGAMRSLYQDARRSKHSHYMLDRYRNRACLHVVHGTYRVLLSLQCTILGTCSDRAAGPGGRINAESPEQELGPTSVGWSKVKLLANEPPQREPAGRSKVFVRAAFYYTSPWPECIPCTLLPTSCNQTTRRNSTQYTVWRTCGCDASSARHRRRCRRHSSALREATVGRRVVETTFEHTLLSHPVCYLCARLALVGSRAITSSGRALRATGFSEPLTTSDHQRVGFDGHLALAPACHDGASHGAFLSSNI